MSLVGKCLLFVVVVVVARQMRQKLTCVWFCVQLSHFNTLSLYSWPQTGLRNESEKAVSKFERYYESNTIFLFCSVLLCLFYRSVSIATVLLILLFYSFIICLPICSFVLCWWLHCVIAFAFFCFVLFALMYREVNKHACVFVFVWVRVYKSWILRLRIAWSLSFSLVVFVISSWVCFCLKTFMRDEILAKYAKLCGILTISLPSVCMCVCVTFVFINIYFILTTCSLRRR